MVENLNFTPQRGPSVWDRPAPDEARRKWEIAAAVLLAAGAASAFAGGMLLYRSMRRNQGLPSGTTGRGAAARRRLSGDLVTEESEQSFPASDAPSWTPADGATLDLPRRR